MDGLLDGGVPLLKFFHVAADMDVYIPKGIKDMAKHPMALYRDKGKVRKIRFEDLPLPKKLEEARSNRLFNPTWDFRLSVQGGDRPHFFSLASKGRRSTDRTRDTSKEHNNRIDYLLEELDNVPPKRTMEFGTYLKSELSSSKEWVAIAEVKHYEWKKEVTRALSGTARCRHDLFGQRATDLNLTGRYPWVAIEVIHEHYPNQATLAGFLALSASMPLIVLFDFATTGNYYMKVDAQLRRIRATFYIYNGCVWENDINHGNQMSAEAFKAMTQRVRGQ